MNKYNYNRDLIMALHSFFWYDGLLETVRDEDGYDVYLDFDKEGNILPEGSDARTPNYFFSRPKYREDCFIYRLIDELRNKKTKYEWYTREDADKLFDEKEYIETFNQRYSMLWQMLVEMFGECGTSPRTGWIEKRNECADFLEVVVKYEELDRFDKLDLEKTNE